MNDRSEVERLREEVARLNAELEAERRHAGQWREVAEERRVTLERFRQHPAVRLVFWVAGWLLPRVRRARRRVRRAERRARRAVSSVAGLPHRLSGPSREAELRRAVRALPGPPEDPRSVSLVILTRDGREHLERLLPALHDRTAHDRVETIVFDNGSGPDTRRFLEAQAGIRVVRSETNLTYSEANNRAAAAAAGDVLCFLNDDVEPLSHGWLSRMLRELRGDVVAVGAQLVYPRRPLLASTRTRDVGVQHRGIELRPTGGMPAAVNLGEGADADVSVGAEEVAAVTAACLLVDRETFEEVGGFDGRYVYGAEDVDLCWRLRRVVRGVERGGVAGGAERGGVAGGVERGVVAGGAERGGVAGGVERGGVAGGVGRGGVAGGVGRGVVAGGVGRGGVAGGVERGRIVVATDAVLFHREGATRFRETDLAERNARQARNWAALAGRFGPQLRRAVDLDRLHGQHVLSRRPFEVAITITRDLPEAGYGDWFTAHELADELEGLGWRVRYIERYRDAWYELPDSVDAVVVLLDTFDVSRVARPGLTTIAWIRNWTERWISTPWFDEFDLVLVSSGRQAELVAERSRKRATVFPLATNPSRFAPDTVERARADDVPGGQHPRPAAGAGPAGKAADRGDAGLGVDAGGTGGAGLGVDAGGGGEAGLGVDAGGGGEAGLGVDAGGGGEAGRGVDAAGPGGAGRGERQRVVFTGNYWGRDTRVDALVAAVPDLEVYGKGWDGVPGVERAWRGSLDYDDLPGLYRDALVVVDQAASHTRGYGSVNSRVFDALAAGALAVTDQADGARELFGDRLPTYSTPEELGRLVADLRADPARAARLAAELREAVVAEHSYAARARHLRDLLVERAEQPTFVLKIGAPDRRAARTWGDWHLAEALGRELHARGHAYRIATSEGWDDPDAHAADVCLHLKGRSVAERTDGQVHAIWNISHPEELTPEECDAADLVLVASRTFPGELRGRTSTPVEVLLQATDEHRFKPVPAEPAHVHDVAFVGNSKFTERPVVREAIRAGLRPAIYGANWEKYVDPSLVVAAHVLNQELAVVYSSVRVLLNDHWEGMRRHGFVSNRLFDALACGACVVSDHLDELTGLFGDAVATYDGTAENLGRVVGELLADEGRRGAMATHGRETVLAAHTFAHRADELLAALEPILAGRDLGTPTTRRVGGTGMSSPAPPASSASPASRVPPQSQPSASSPASASSPVAGSDGPGDIEADGASGGGR